MIDEQRQQGLPASRRPACRFDRVCPVPGLGQARALAHEGALILGGQTRKSASGAADGVRAGHESKNRRGVVRPQPGVFAALPPDQ